MKNLRLRYLKSRIEDLFIPSKLPELWVSHKHKCAYFAIQKTGCSSIKSIFYARGIYPERINIKEKIKGIFKNRSIVKNKGYFKFTVVRNPWDRLFSLYKDYTTNKKKAEHVAGFKGDSFESFVKHICKIPDWRSNRHFKSQYLTVTDIQGNVIVDGVAHFERYGKEVGMILKKAGLSNSVPHKNRIFDVDYKKYYNNKTKRLVENRYKKDIKIFGYRFDAKCAE